MNAKIIGTGSYLPENVLTNDDLSRMVDTNDEWIRTRTGILRRHIAKDVNTAEMAAKAAANALENSNVLPDMIDLLVVATSTPDYAMPSCSCLVQGIIGAENAMCVDINAACSGFIEALDIANAYLKAGIYKCALVIGAERMSQVVDFTDRNTCVLFGDGAGACVVKATDEPGGIIDRQFSADGLKAEFIIGGSISDKTKRYTAMNGQEVFKFATRKVPESIESILEKNTTVKDEINHYILHQANIRIIENVAKKLGVPFERFPSNIAEYGNTSSASIPILLDEMNRNNKLRPNDKIILSGFGAGLSWGSILMEW